MISDVHNESYTVIIIIVLTKVSLETDAQIRQHYSIVFFHFYEFLSLLAVKHVKD